MEKPLETAWTGLRVGWVGVSGNHQDGAKSVSQVNGVSDTAPPVVCVCVLGGSLRKATMVSASPFVWQKAAPLLSPQCQTIQCVSLVPFKLLPQCWSSKGVNLHKFMPRPFREHLGLTQPQSPLVFTVRSYGNLFSWH